MRRDERVVASLALVVWLSSLPVRVHAVGQTVTAADLDELLEASVPEAMEHWHVPGAVVVVVEDGEVLLSRGYGSATLDPPTPMLPDRTELRVFSLSKPITALGTCSYGSRAGCASTTT
jgi:CubicO group peptidase (beta-lactamase class C family)